MFSVFKQWVATGGRSCLKLNTDQYGFLVYLWLVSFPLVEYSALVTLLCVSHT